LAGSAFCVKEGLQQAKVVKASRVQQGSFRSAIVLPIGKVLPISVEFLERSRQIGFDMEVPRSLACRSAGDAFGISNADLSSACYSLDPHGCSIMVLPFGKLGDADCRGAEGHCRRSLPKGTEE
ncbi:unnamed protein product, partial [Prunus brigantina]